jgi:hypothetical protein
MQDTTNLYGIGKGFAQVLPASRSAQVYMQMAERKKEQDRLDQRQVADMLTKLKPNELRPADIPEFNQKYTELQNLYHTNKDLYRNPLKNQEAYNKAQSLIGELRSLASESKEVTDFTGKVGEIFMKDKDQLENNMPEFLGKLKNMPVSQLKAAMGGRLPDYSDVEFKPKPIDYNKIQDTVFDIAKSVANGIQQTPVTIKGDGSKIPLGKIYYRDDKTVNPIAIASATEFMMHDDNFRKNMVREFNQLPGEEQDAYQNPEEYAKAKLVERFHIIPGKESLVEDEGYNQEVKAKERNNTQNFQKELENTRFQHNLELKKYSKELATKTAKIKEDKLLKDATNMIEALNRDVHPREMNKAIAPLLKGSMAFAGAPYYISPRTMTTASRYKVSVDLANKSAKIKAENPEELFKQRATLLVIPLRDSKGETENIIIRPKSPGAREQMYGVLQYITGAKPETGVTQSYDEGD